MKYYEDVLFHLRIARLIKKAKQIREEGDYFKACVIEYEARCLFSADIIIRHNFDTHIVSVWQAPISEIQHEVEEAIRFFRNGFKYHLKNKHEK